MEINSTTNYKQFKILKGNREILPNHVKLLIKSIADTNLLPANPIIVNSRMEIIDGQHRLKAAEALKLPIFYVQMDSANAQDITLLNDNVRKWQLRDYIHFYKERGIESYAVLDNFIDQSGLSAGIVAKLLFHFLGNANNDKTYSYLKAGEFEANFLEEAKQLMEKLQQIRPFIEGDSWKNRELIRSLILFYQQADHETFLAKLREYPEKIYSRRNILGYLREFEDIYNYKSKNKILISNRVRVKPNFV